ncbi:MAG: TIGR01459 family HAD-type hydrolase, partial [Pseudomonadota bacterium]
MADAPRIPILSGIAELDTTHRAWLVDVWGVMHNGVSAFREAVNACARFRASGGFVVLLTNAPRPAPS